MKQIAKFLLATLVLVIFIGSCKKDDADSNLKSVFSYVADGFKVTFTNFSSGAKEYEWDFGDNSGQGSTLKSPQHVFSQKGDFLVTLTAKNGAGTDVFTDTVSIIGPNIKIDGDFTDWEYVEYLHVNNDAFGGSIQAVKAFATSQDINFYVEGTADMKFELIDMYIDSDNNPATGYSVGEYAAGSGMDHLLEGPAATPSWGAVYEHAGGPGDWAFNSISTFDEAMSFSAVKPVSGKNVIEFSIKKSALGVTSGSINFALVELTSGWAGLGRIPENATPESKFLTVPL